MPKSRARYLTKSRYKLALECPTKLFYTGKPDEYPDASLDDAFLRALARGGFQVGELAKCYFPDGIEVEALGHDEALARTDELLRQERVTIFEAAIRVGRLFVRIDVLVKNGTNVWLIEVKSKSFDPGDELPFYDKRSYRAKTPKIKLKQDYAAYLYDVAFQTHVLRLARPDLVVAPYLMLADKSKVTTVEGLNQLFLLKKAANGRSYAEPRSGITAAELGERILCEVPVAEAVEAILADQDHGRTAAERYQGLPFAEEVAQLAERYGNDEKIVSSPGKKCRNCQFRTAAASGKSGFQECWQAAAKLTEAELAQPFVFDVWKYTKADALIGERRFLMKDMTEEDLAPKAGEDPGLSQSERQWLQVAFHQQGHAHAHVDVAGLRAAAATWKYPLHFIDFETTMVAIPFNTGCRPYQQIAFQFSHHVLHEDGRIEHVDQFLNRERGVFPNFAFVRALKKSLSTDNGTIFRYATHENTVLCQIYEQLRTSREPDKNELMFWIQTITRSGAGNSDTWQGERCMVDMWELAKRFYYHPATGGSISIKKVLPAALSDAPGLLERFAQPIYGRADGVKSLNFDAWTWIRYQGEQLVDPYTLLPSVYEGVSGDQLDSVMCDDELADGGAAMTAYSMMQFAEMPEAERERLSQALLKYCELDTFAMVLLFEYWQEFVTGKREPKAA